VTTKEIFSLVSYLNWALQIRGPLGENEGGFSSLFYITVEPFK
jgi:hypothetical protein